MINPILEQIRLRIDARGITPGEAATEIGVGTSSLLRHLAGEYVRSDSLAKYRLWINGDTVSVRTSQDLTSSPANSAEPPLQVMDLEPPLLIPDRPRYVVDLFCGCGGMSLGFERFKDGLVFRTVMALDIEEPMVRVFNDNHHSSSEDLSIGRQSDITDFMNEAEILAYYLDHLSRSTGNQDLIQELSRLGKYSLAEFRKQLYELDLQFLEQLALIRCSKVFLEAIKKMGTGVLGQTSIIGFHNATKLPSTGSAYPRLGPLIWHNDGVPAEDAHSLRVNIDSKTSKLYRLRAQKLWDLEIKKLALRSEGSGHGQLASAAERIQRFLGFVETKSMENVRKLWIEWRSSREAIRATFFENSLVHSRLRQIYEQGHQVSVLLGGPPCQGFSRIGRGKIRSLREQSVHVQEDEDSVDSRNQLMHQYVLFVAALAPEVFLFENVRHFQAVVRSEGVEYDAADILAESIQTVSDRGLGYAIARKIVVASQHSIPQNRERFVMAAVRKDRSGALSGMDAASWCLSLPIREPVPLLAALEDLPEPHFSNQFTSAPVISIEPHVMPARSGSASDIYRNWIRKGGVVDSHIARPPRQDDSSFFSLMGPAKRWMDYRCDNSDTLARLCSVLGAVKNAISVSPNLAKTMGISVEEITNLAAITDGSLSLRLMLENIAPHPGELQHHLLTATYLQKKEGAHGDWLSRMDPTQPSKTIVSHMAKDTYAFVHPFVARTLSVREAARVQSFPDDYRFGSVGLVDGFRVVGNAVPPLLSMQFAERVAQVLALVDASHSVKKTKKIASLAAR